MATKKSKKKAGKKSKKKAAGALPCLSVWKAFQIVNRCAPKPIEDIDKALEEVGLITPGLRKVFRECVFNSVLVAGCRIRRSQIPNSASTTFRDVRDAIRTTPRR